MMRKSLQAAYDKYKIHFWHIEGNVWRLAKRTGHGPKLTVTYIPGKINDPACNDHDIVEMMEHYLRGIGAPCL